MTKLTLRVRRDGKRTAWDIWWNGLSDAQRVVIESKMRRAQESAARVRAASRRRLSPPWTISFSDPAVKFSLEDYEHAMNTRLMTEYKRLYLGEWMLAEDEEDNDE